MPDFDLSEHIRQSNLIENIDDRGEDRRSLKAWQYLVAQDQISQPVLLELHKMITRKQLPKSESGSYRRVNVWVGGRQCPAPVIAHGQIYGFLMDLAEHWQTLDPVEMHIRYEKIHPFVDGNGRTGRMIMWWHQIKLGQEPMIISWENRRAYYQWFAEAEL